MENRDAAVLCMYACPASTSLMIDQNNGEVEPVEAFLAGCEEIFRSAWASNGALADESYSGGEFCAAFATVEEALQRALSIKSRVSRLATRLRMIGGVSAALAFGPVLFKSGYGPIGMTVSVATEMRRYASARRGGGSLLLSEPAAAMVDPALRARCTDGPSFEVKRIGVLNTLRFPWDDPEVISAVMAKLLPLSASRDKLPQVKDDPGYIPQDPPDEAVLMMFPNPTPRAYDFQYQDTSEPVDAFLRECDEVFRSQSAREGAISLEPLRHSRGNAYLATFRTVDIAVQRALAIKSAVSGRARRLGVNAGVAAGISLGPVWPMNDGKLLIGETVHLADELRRYAGTRGPIGMSLGPSQELPHGKLLLSEKAASVLAEPIRSRCSPGPSFEMARTTAVFHSKRFPWHDESLRHRSDRDPI